MSELMKDFSAYAGVYQIIANLDFYTPASLL